MVKVHPPPPMDRLFRALPASGELSLASLLQRAHPVDEEGRYLHWTEIKHRSPPAGQTVETQWLGMKLARQAASRDLPFSGAAGRPITFANIDQVQALVHRIDRGASGQMLAEQHEALLSSSDRYLVNALREEAIASSLFEGANTTRRAAKAMLRSGRQPKDRGERMILNNYRAVEAAARLARGAADLRLADILELHGIVTTGTLDDEGDAGRLRGPGDDDIVVMSSTQEVIHQPPPSTELERRIAAVIEFANAGEDAGRGFVHPVVRAILLHFMIGYIHPFVDGNGRTARALFYWSMLRSGYWLAPYLTISTILQRDRRSYELAYEYADTDGHDATYFVLNQLGVIDKALDGFDRYLRRQLRDARRLERRLWDSDLNHRQMAVLRRALRHAGEPITIDSHRQEHRIAYATARGDLLALEERGLLAKRRSGKKFIFRADDDLEERLGG